MSGKVSSSGILNAGNAFGILPTLLPTFGIVPGTSAGDPNSGGAGGTGGTTAGGQVSPDANQANSAGTSAQSGPPGTNLPNLDDARNIRSSQHKRIHANDLGGCNPGDPGYPDCGDEFPPTADPGGPYTGHVGTSVGFSGLGIAGSGYIVSYSWTFGDSSGASGASPSHTYSATGTYTVSLTVTDSNSLSDTEYTTATITTAGSPPVSRPGGPYSGLVSSSISFNGSTSSATATGATITGYSWSFGDGGTGTGATPTHTYTTASTYTVSLTVTDSNGSTNTATTTATISTSSNQPPVSSPGGPYSAAVSTSISFDGLGSYDPDGTISSYSWTFGDGGTGSGSSPTHTYSVASNYTVTLTVTDNNGASTSATTTASIGNGTNIYTTLFDPSNAVGSGGEDPFSGNFNWQLPILGLPGRAGLDLGLGLSYNSLVWTKEGSAIGFNLDQGSPSPGFHLGFPTIMSGYNTILSQTTYMMVMPSGARVEFRPTTTTGLYETGDSSHTQLTINSSTSITVRGVDGSQLSYVQESTSPLVFKCTNITDRNGNYITITYTSGNLNQITDSVGRVITFNYDGAGRLSTITQPLGSSTHASATFSYTNLVINTNYSGLTLVGVANGNTISVLSQVALNQPGIADGPTFTFTYNSYGQVYKISELAGDNHLLNYVSYNLPTDTTAQSDCPRFTQKSVYAENWNSGTPVTTSYSISTGQSFTSVSGSSDTGTMSQVTTPDGTIYKIYSTRVFLTDLDDATDPNVGCSMDGKHAPCPKGRMFIGGPSSSGVAGTSGTRGGVGAAGTPGTGGTQFGAGGAASLCCAPPGAGGAGGVVGAGGALNAGRSDGGLSGAAGASGFLGTGGAIGRGGAIGTGGGVVGSRAAPAEPSVPSTPPGVPVTARAAHRRRVRRLGRPDCPVPRAGDVGAGRRHHHFPIDGQPRRHRTHAVSRQLGRVPGLRLMPRGRKRRRADVELQLRGATPDAIAPDGPGRHGAVPLGWY